MKLYATTTSERASKGQGGNKFIVIDLKIDPILRLSIGRIELSCSENGGSLTSGTDYILKYIRPDQNYQVLYEEKIKHTTKYMTEYKAEFKGKPRGGYKWDESTKAYIKGKQKKDETEEFEDIDDSVFFDK